MYFMQFSTVKASLASQMYRFEKQSNHWMKVWILFYIYFNKNILYPFNNDYFNFTSGKFTYKFTDFTPSAAKCFKQVIIKRSVMFF